MPSRPLQPSTAPAKRGRPRKDPSLVASTLPGASGGAAKPRRPVGTGKRGRPSKKDIAERERLRQEEKKAEEQQERLKVDDEEEEESSDSE